jgi:hypothetical protein
MPITAGDEASVPVAAGEVAFMPMMAAQSEQESK